MADILTVVAWNLKDDGGPDLDRWWPAMDLLAGIKPDAFLMQEGKYSRRNGHRRMHAVEERLGLRGFLAAENRDAPDLPAVVYIRPGRLGVIESPFRARPWWLHPSHVVVRLKDIPAPLHLVSFHMSWLDPKQRLTEARWLTSLAQPGMVTLAAGDTNSYPQKPDPDITLPDWDLVPDRAHYVHRTNNENGGRRSDTQPDEALTSAGFIDLARHAADHLDQPDALAPTAGKPDQSGPQRIDRMYATGGLADALISLEVVDPGAISDHRLLVAKLHRDRLARILREQAAAGGDTAPDISPPRTV